jgi:hypothetical protein
LSGILFQFQAQNLSHPLLTHPSNLTPKCLSLPANQDKIKMQLGNHSAHEVPSLLAGGKGTSLFFVVDYSTNDFLAAYFQSVIQKYHAISSQST